MASAFDPKAFLDQILDAPTERRDPLPVENPERPDKLYVGVIGEVDSVPWQGREDPTQSGIRWVVPIEIQVPAGMQSTRGLPSTLSFKDSVMLDLNAGGLIDNAKGKNGKLRMYRDALDMNKQGDSFSARKMQGRPILVKISHEVYQGNPVERIAAVLKM